MAARRSGRSRAVYAWARLGDQRLLDMRLCDLKLQIAGSPLEPRIEALHRELGRAGLRFRPYVYLSDDWFAKDGHPGFAIPFYLAHPRLIRLERTMMLDVEAGTRDWCMRILRHETAHAIDTAYRLYRRRGYRALFGEYHQPYPDSYRPRPASRRYVLHLDLWYAQSHPAEDFAETFAVWLNPRSRWRQMYERWPALAKLQYVQTLMDQVGPQPSVVRRRRQHRPLSSLKLTLREYYERKRTTYGHRFPEVPERDLLRLFAERGSKAAAPVIEAERAALRMRVSRWTGETQFTIDRTIADLVQRCQRQDLRLTRPVAETTRDLLAMLTFHTMNFMHDAGHRISM